MQILLSSLATLALLQAGAQSEPATAPTADAVTHEATEPAAVPDVEAADAERENGNEVKCKRQKLAGSRLASRRICRTIAEWKAYEEDTKRTIREVQARNAATPI